MRFLHNINLRWANYLHSEAQCKGAASGYWVNIDDRYFVLVLELKVDICYNVGWVMSDKYGEQNTNVPSA